MPEDISVLKQKFAELPPKLGLRFLRRAGRKAAEIVREDARLRAPVDTGKLQNEMMTRTRKEDDRTIEIDVGPSRAGWYGRFQEFGTAHHTAQPFLEPAFVAIGPEAARVFAEEIKKEILNHFRY